MRQESHRIHWQQWGKDPQSRRDLITRSAAVRITDAATAKDVIHLLGESLNLVGDGVLILVGTLYGMPPVIYDLLGHHEEVLTTGVPFHLIRSLRDNDNPLQVRDLMQQALEKNQKETPILGASHSIISPKLQWFFIPNDLSSPIIKYLELDGYSTTLEDENFEDEDEDDGYEYTDAENASPIETPWRLRDEDSKSTKSDTDFSSNTLFSKQMKRSQQLAQHNNTTDHYIVSGYLWKQSQIDPHVWRKVHCVVTEEHLSFIARIKKRANSLGNASYHGRIPLSMALVVESSSISQTSSAPLSRIPFSWELVTASGRSHFFRTVSNRLQQRWIGCLKDRILQCQENKLIQQAELIVSDEMKARNRRLTHLMDSNTFSNRDLIHWTFLVFEYRELCRHIQHRMPAKAFVVAKSSSSVASQRSSSPVEMPSFDDDLQSMVRAAWEMASKLLQEVTAKQLHSTGRNAETLCRHVDYVLTGRMRLLPEVGTPVDVEHVNKSTEPPPASLFDALLAELMTKDKGMM